MNFIVKLFHFTCYILCSIIVFGTTQKHLIDSMSLNNSIVEQTITNEMVEESNARFAEINKPKRGHVIDHRKQFLMVELIADPGDRYEIMDDGTIMAKHETYYYGLNNEDRLANEQSISEKFGRGFAKSFGNIFSYIGMLTHGVSAGVIQALNTHEFSDTCNNETFVNYQINIDKNEYRHLQYIADKYQQKGMIERIFTDFSTWFSVDLRRGAEPVIAATLVGSIFPVINFVFFFK